MCQVKGDLRYQAAVWSRDLRLVAARAGGGGAEGGAYLSGLSARSLGVEGRDVRDRIFSTFVPSFQDS